MLRRGLVLLGLLLLLTGCAGAKESISVPVPDNTTQSAGENETVPDNETAEPVQPETHHLRLTVTGDIMCHDYQYNEAYDAASGTYDFSHNFADMKPYFDQADLVIGNLETVFAGGEPHDFPLFNSPDAFLEAVADAGFDLVTTANNHCLDQGETGVTRTLDLLDELGVDHVGTYRDKTEKDAAIRLREVNGIKLAILAYSYGFNGNRVPSSDLVSLLDADTVKADIAKAKALDPDFIIVLPHMGMEYAEAPSAEVKSLVQTMFDAGADIVLASHPHVLQPMAFVEKSDGGRGFVMYSLGNFISAQTTPPRNASILLSLDLEVTGEERTIEQVSFVPIWTQFRLPSGRDHFVVRSVYQMLTLPEADQTALLRAKDIVRLKEIHAETTKLLLYKEIPLENIQDSYIFKE